MQLFTNNAGSVLDGAITSTTTSITLASGTGNKFPSPAGGDYFLATLYLRVDGLELNHEIVKCTARSSDVLTITRAQESTTARDFASGTPVELRVTAATMGESKAIPDWNATSGSAVILNKPTSLAAFTDYVDPVGISIVFGS